MLGGEDDSPSPGAISQSAFQTIGSALSSRNHGVAGHVAGLSGSGRIPVAGRRGYITVRRQPGHRRPSRRTVTTRCRIDGRLSTAWTPVRRLSCRLSGEVPGDRLVEVEEHSLLADGHAEWRAPDGRKDLRVEADEP